jgi:hypothetical protein
VPAVPEVLDPDPAELVPEVPAVPLDEVPLPVIASLMGEKPQPSSKHNGAKSIARLIASRIESPFFMASLLIPPDRGGQTLTWARRVPGPSAAAADGSSIAGCRRGGAPFMNADQLACILRVRDASLRPAALRFDRDLGRQLLLDQLQLLSLLRFPVDGRKALSIAEVHPLRFLDATRHTLASLLLQSRAPLPSVQKIVRHSTPTTEVYGHLAGDDLRADVNRLEFGFEMEAPPSEPSEAQQAVAGGCVDAESPTVCYPVATSGSEGTEAPLALAAATSWAATRISKAGGGDRTPDIDLGKVALYR